MLKGNTAGMPGFRAHTCTTTFPAELRPPERDDIHLHLALDQLCHGPTLFRPRGHRHGSYGGDQLHSALSARRLKRRSTYFWASSISDVRPYTMADHNPFFSRGSVNACNGKLGPSRHKLGPSAPMYTGRHPDNACISAHERVWLISPMATGMIRLREKHIMLWRTPTPFIMMPT